MVDDRPRDILLVRNGASPLAREACDRARGIFAADGYTTVYLDAPSARELSERLTDTLRSRALHVAAVVAVAGCSISDEVRKDQRMDYIETPRDAMQTLQESVAFLEEIRTAQAGPGVEAGEQEGDDGEVQGR